MKALCTAILLILLCTVNLSASMRECLTTCTSSSGLNVRILQSENGWEMRIYDGTTVIGEYNGTGQYSGTICEGMTSCQF